MRITFVISSLLGGGAERTVANMAAYWTNKGWEITVLTLFHGRGPLAYDLHPKVRHIDLLSTTLHHNPRPDAASLLALRHIFDSVSPPERKAIMDDIVLIVALRHAIVKTNPDRVISFIDATNIRVLLALYKLNLKVLVSERSDPRQVSTGREGWDLLRHRLYPLADRIILLHPEAMSFFSPKVQARCRVISNAAFYSGGSAAKEPRSRNGENKLLSMGRLEREKGIDLLLHAFSRVAPRHPSWFLDIWGEGPQRSLLQDLARDLNLSERVRFRGFTQSPFQVMQRSDLFVLPSRFEGFPNVLLEAMSCGLPSVSFDCPTGPGQIIRHGIDGLLVPPEDVGALIAALDRLMGNESERARLACRAPEVIERFSVSKIMGMWEDAVC
jgi:GalNAc-alpha-(1->4)-GalNAc-alpha-(1->3)-diNAcBac-PP-undecaprenol alpha-1,4-N-acetyl-D-galactosaminyltransferase